jgi:hypothetical protein
MSFENFQTYVRESNDDRRSLHSSPPNEDDVEDSRTNETQETEPSKSAEQQQAESAWRDTIYDVYYEKFKTMRNSTLINKEKYNRIVQSLLHYQSIRRRGPSLAVIPSDARQYAKIYDLKRNIGQQCLYRNGLLVTTYEDVFDMMQVAHVSLGHARDIKKNKAKLDQQYYSIPESCICLFLRLCPYCCLARTKKVKSKVPLKMILTPRVGHRAQIDLIDMGALSINGERYILRYVDHYLDLAMSIH